MAMKLWLVDHSHGAALVYAESKDEAAEMSDALGEVFDVFPFNGPIAFDLARTDEGDVICNSSWDFEGELEAAIKLHRIALDASEYNEMHPEEEGEDDGGEDVDEEADDNGDEEEDTEDDNDDAEDDYEDEE